MNDTTPDLKDWTPSPYVEIIGNAVQALHDKLTAQYGDCWRLRIERTNDGFQVKRETYDAQGFGAGESFHITPVKSAL